MYKIAPIFFITLLIYSCEKKNNNESNVHLPEEDTLLNQVYEEIVNQDLLDIDSYEQLKSNIETTNEMLNIERNSSYDNITNTTSTTITIEPKENSLTEVTIIENIPKEVAKSILEISFKTAPTQIIKEDPLLMWHFDAVEHRIDLSYAVDNNHSSTGSHIPISAMFYRRSTQNIPSDFPSMDINVSGVTSTSANITVQAISNGTQIGEVYLWVQESIDDQPVGMGSYKYLGKGAGEYIYKLENLSANKQYWVKGSLRDYTYHFNNFHSLWFTTPTVNTGNADGTIADIDGNIYQTIQIGNQLWMAENLKTTRYSDGTSLVYGEGVGNIVGDFTSKYYFIYENIDANTEILGLYYTFAAASNGADYSDSNPSGIQGICPTGWHLPSRGEFEELLNALEDPDYNNLIEGGNSGFEATFAGQYMASGNYVWKDEQADFWSTTYAPADARYSLRIQSSGNVFFDQGHLAHGYSVRCLKD